MYTVQKVTSVSQDLIPVNVKVYCSPSCPLFCRYLTSIQEVSMYSTATDPSPHISPFPCPLTQLSLKMSICFDLVTIHRQRVDMFSFLTSTQFPLCYLALWFSSWHAIVPTYPWKCILMCCSFSPPLLNECIYADRKRALGPHMIGGTQGLQWINSVFIQFHKYFLQTEYEQIYAVQPSGLFQAAFCAIRHRGNKDKLRIPAPVDPISEGNSHSS